MGLAGWSNFGGFVLGCMDSYGSGKRRIFQRFSGPTRFAYFCTVQISKVQYKSVQNLRYFLVFKFQNVSYPQRLMQFQK